MAEHQEQDEVEAEEGYVALLHGTRKEYFLYALVLGHRLKRFDPDIPRVLLLGRPLPDQQTSFAEGASLKCLSALWTVRLVDLVDALEADKTPRKRHRYVFTKLRAFEVPFRRILFIDLDTIVLKSLKPLFQVQAPAGMYHGWRSCRDLLQHGSLINQEALDGCCINAGLMRIDPPNDRQRFLQEMLKEVAELSYQTMLPEQYYLVEKLSGWRHIDVSWNCEVSPCIYVNMRQLRDRESSSEIRYANLCNWAEMPKDWWLLGTTKEELKNAVGMFHFSGTNLEPWWFLHHRADTSYALLEKQYLARDCRGMVALSVTEWLRAVEELWNDASLPPIETETVRATICNLRREAWWWADWHNACSKCGAEDGWSRLCEECLVRTYAHTLLEDGYDRWGRWVHADSKAKHPGQKRKKGNRKVMTNKRDFHRKTSSESSGSQRQFKARPITDATATFSP